MRFCGNDQQNVIYGVLSSSTFLIECTGVQIGNERRMVVVKFLLLSLFIIHQNV